MRISARASRLHSRTGVFSASLSMMQSSRRGKAGALAVTIDNRKE